jgi:hypothetical protein
MTTDFGSRIQKSLDAIGDLEGPEEFVKKLRKHLLVEDN